MASIARRLFSVFVADMEMQCTPKHCSYPFSKRSSHSLQHRRLSPDLELGKSPGFCTSTCGLEGLDPGLPTSVYFTSTHLHRKADCSK
jgi:hypothetical protein